MRMKSFICAACAILPAIVASESVLGQPGAQRGFGRVIASGSGSVSGHVAGGVFGQPNGGQEQGGIDDQAPDLQGLGSEFRAAGFGYAEFGRAFQGAANSAGGRLRSNTSAATSSSKSISAVENGKRIRIDENSAGVAVSVDGETIRANNPAELRNRSAEAYRLYEKYAKRAHVSARASATGSGAATGGTPEKSESVASKERSVSVIEDGKMIAIAETVDGISVTVDGRTEIVKHGQLERLSPEARALYEKHAGTRDEGVLDRALETRSIEMLREEIDKIRDSSAGNPQMQRALDEVLRELR